MSVGGSAGAAAPRPTIARAGRAASGAGIALGAGGVVTIVAIGRWDHLPLGTALFGVFAAGFGTMAWLALGRQPSNCALLVPAASSLLAGVSGASFATAVWAAQRSGLAVTPNEWEALAPVDVPSVTQVGMQLVNIGPVFGFFSMLTLWLLLFPDGQLPSRRWRWMAGTGVIGMAALFAVLTWVVRSDSTISYGAMSSTYPPGIASLADPLYLFVMLVSAICLVSLIRRYRRSSGDLRQQYRWVLLGSVALFLALAVVDQSIGLLLAALAGIVVSVACYGVAVTKHRLYDIDLVISRAFVYGTLAAFIGAVYVVVVVVVGGWLRVSPDAQASDDLALSVAATAVVALAFEPVRRRTQKWANRLVYGKRASPYEVLADVSQRLAGAEPAAGVLKRMTQLMAEGTGAHQSTVWLKEGQDLIAVAGWPDLPEPSRVRSLEILEGTFSPVSHEGEVVGVLEVVKERGHPVTPTEQRLITDLAGSAGLLLGHQRLNASLAARAAELRSSRRRLVELGDAERRRLERDLHDGAQQQVVALKLKIALGEHIARKAGDEDAALRMGHLTAEVQETLEEIRRVARGIYPQLVESESVVTAIRTRALGSPIPVDVSAANVGTYPPDVQAAIYFAAVEAITNASAYARPSHIDVGITDTGAEIVVTVTDDGSGFDPPSTGEGVGLTNIRDRVEALGGELVVRSAIGVGTMIEARIPVERRDKKETEAGEERSAAPDLTPHSSQSAGHEVRLG